MRACSAAARSSSLFPNSLRRRSTILDESQRPVGESTATTTRNRLRHYGLASRLTIEKIATARSPVTGTERGVSNCEGDTRYLCFTTLCQESIPGALSPRFRSLQWAATPKLTMIAGAGNFPSGSSRCESFLFNPTIADENAESGGQRPKNARKAHKQRSKNIS